MTSTVRMLSGYRRLDPVPAPDDLSEFYESAYYDLLRKGGRAPLLQRLTNGGPAAETERAWLRVALHADILHWLDQHGHSQRRQLVEVGCGTGDFLRSAVEQGWNVLGLEPAEQAQQVCRSQGLDVRGDMLAEFAADGGTADVAVLLLVLEHVPDPVAMLADVERVLTPGGLVVVQVPNDFNPLQEAARRLHGLDQWWVADPDHINYFDFTSLTQLMDEQGFDVVEQSATFPMELFLLMGDNYVGNPEVGSACHARRVALETNLDGSTRRRLQGALAHAGLGRTCVLVARKR